MSHLFDIRRSLTEGHLINDQTDIASALMTLDIRHHQTASLLEAITDMIDDSNFSEDHILSSLYAAKALLSTAAEAFDAVYAFCSEADKANKAAEARRGLQTGAASADA